MMRKNPFKNHLALLPKLGLDLAEWYVLTTVASSPIPFDAIPQKTSALSDGDPRGKINVKGATLALKSCVQKAWVTRVTVEYLSVIRWFLQREDAMGPIYGLPNVGDADFTPEGAEKFATVVKRLHPDLQEHEEFEIQNGKTQIIVPNRETARGIAENRKGAKLQRVGPWKVYWWKTYPEGFLITPS